MAPRWLSRADSPSGARSSLWAAVIFALSAIPGLATDLGVWDTILRKAAHATEYAILALLLFRALGRELPAFAIGFAYAIRTRSTRSSSAAATPRRSTSPWTRPGWRSDCCSSTSRGFGQRCRGRRIA